jgi:hypothetical protein
MSIRNYLGVVLPLTMTTLACAAIDKKEWENFKETHDLLLLIKHKNKNEERWAKFALSSLSDDSHQVSWIEREDFLPKDKKIEIEKMTREQQCNHFEQTVGGKDDKFVMLTIGLVHPTDQIYVFIMDTCYGCITAYVVPNEKALQKPTVKEKAKEYAGKFQKLLATAWHKVTGKKGKKE